MCQYGKRTSFNKKRKQLEKKHQDATNYIEKKNENLNEFIFYAIKPNHTHIKVESYAKTKMNFLALFHFCACVSVLLNRKLVSFFFAQHSTL